MKLQIQWPAQTRIVGGGGQKHVAPTLAFDIPCFRWGTVWLLKAKWGNWYILHKISLGGGSKICPSLGNLTIRSGPASPRQGNKTKTSLLAATAVYFQRTASFFSGIGFLIDNIYVNKNNAKDFFLTNDDISIKIYINENLY